jgi:hypothetical protein
MTSPTIERMSELLDGHSGLCVSLYMPTHRRFPDHQQNPLRFRNLVREAARSLTAEVGETETNTLLEPLHALAENQAFWAHPQDGLAVFRASNFYRVMKLQRTVPERAIVADSFHTKPLLRIVQSADRFHILALTREHVRLFQGSRDAVDEVELAAGIPRTLTEALGDQVTEAHETAAAYNKGGGNQPGDYMRHGIGGRKDELDKDTERFFRVVDRAILEHYSKPYAIPILLAALPEHHSTFRQLSHNPQLAEEAIGINPDTLDLDSLRAKAWEVFQPRYLKRLEGMVEEFGTANAHGTASDDPEAIALAAIGGRVKTLLVEAERVVPGRVDLATGTVQRSEMSDAHTDDLLDDLSELTLRAGGEVVIVPVERMPSKSGVAATYRF